MALLKDNPGTWMTGEDLFRRPELGPCELVEGRIVPLAPTGHIHGAAEINLGSELRVWARSTGRGRVLGGEVGLYIRRNPDTVRAADLVYISNERFAAVRSAGYLDVAPELVVEILSPEDRWSAVEEKIADYFAAGVARVLVVDPRRRKVLSYRQPPSTARPQTFSEGEVLSDDELLPGFRMVVAEIFVP